MLGANFFTNFLIALGSNGPWAIKKLEDGYVMLFPIIPFLKKSRWRRNTIMDMETLKIVSFEPSATDKIALPPLPGEPDVPARPEARQRDDHLAVELGPEKVMGRLG